MTSPTILSFTVLGVPVPQGSMVAFMPKNAKRPIMHASNGNSLKQWRKQIALAASLALEGGSPAGKKTALRVTALFVLPQAKSNRDSEPVSRRADLDKLIRALLDGMTGVVMEDDAQVTEIYASKEYGAEPRLEVEIAEVGLIPVLIKPAAVKDSELPF